MALEQLRMKPANGWSSKFSLENTKISHQLPVLLGKPTINYTALKQLCSIDGLGDRKRDTTKEAHDEFMKSYSNIFKSTQEKLPALKPSVTLTGKLDIDSTGSIQNGSQSNIHIPHGHRKPHYCSNHDNPVSHNIQDHLASLHKQHIIQTKEDLLKARIQILRRLLRKLPFERKRSEQEAIFHHLKHFTEVTNCIPSSLLKELSNIVQMERWNEAGYLVFGDNALFLILRGSVMPVNDEFVPTFFNQENDLPSFPRKQSETDMVKLIIGQCFGTINGFQGQNGISNDSSRILSVVTLEPCEFLKISARDFGKVKQLVDHKERSQKFDLIQSCRLFENWPKVALSKVVGLIRWKTFHVGEVLVIEGESCQVIGFISEGTCLLKRSIDVVKTCRDGTKTRHQKQVTVGELGPGDSFGECTILLDQPIAYSIVTASRVQLGIISEDDFNKVDDVTKCLLSQCYEAIDNNMSEEELQKQYVEQQKQNEWIKFKRSVLRDVLSHRSILPGYGKWSRNPTMKDVINLA